MTSRWCSLVALVVLASGCTATTGGKAGPAPSSVPHALTGPIIKRALIDGATSVKVDNVDEGIVALRSAADANALFATFASQWRHCDGTTVTTPPVDVYGQNAISDVRVTDSVVAATVSMGSGPHSMLTTIPEARALGVRGNCLVEVMVSFVPTSYPGDEGTGDINTSAIDIAHAVLDKLSTLT
ncbi:hypothetical protein A5682_19715 [Mycobacterium mantenii]|uniref:sensor domain-containing protein n=1 Tax=Mycobacterium mantenii TaxID=560555 RepID=UPI0007FB714F|nr:sensor domain-containing protein [Mycobacterium mantenii]OBH78442.1 hypothetical protein A5682_19715 [Mycobacterium mantenii]